MGARHSRRSRPQGNWVAIWDDREKVWCQEKGGGPLQTQRWNHSKEQESMHSGVTRCDTLDGQIQRPTKDAQIKIPGTAKDTVKLRKWPCEETQPEESWSDSKQPKKDRWS